jgi:hypothetical protein
MTHDNDTTGHDRQSEHFSDASDATEIAHRGAEHTIGGVRSDLVTARKEIRQSIAGDDADLETAAGLIDAALAALCPHDPQEHFHTTADNGEELVTCTVCGISWYIGKRGGTPEE